MTTTVWTPGRTYGWYPRLTIDGDIVDVLSGFGLVWRDRLKLNPDMTWTMLHGGTLLDGGPGAHPMGWIDPQTACWTHEVPGGHRRYQRIDVLLEMPDPPDMAGGAVQMARDGHWVAYQARRDEARVIYDGAVLVRHPEAGAASIAGHWLAHWVQDNTRLRRWSLGQPWDEHAVSGWNVHVSRSGRVAWQTQSHVRGLDVDGTEPILALVALPEAPLAIWDHGDEWLATALELPSGEHLLLLRPWGANVAVQIPGEWVWADIADTREGVTVIAGCDNKGRLSVTALRLSDWPLRPVLIPTPSPVPPPPPTPIPAPSVTITDYSPSHGPAPLTVRAAWVFDSAASGPVTQVLWLWRPYPDGESWEVAADNTSGDPDHHYRFEAPGQYAIAMRAIGPGGSVQTKAVRVVTVEAAPGPPPPPPEPTPSPPAPPSSPGLIARPTAHPDRPAYLVGVCMPTPWPAAMPDLRWIRMMRATAAIHAVRFDLDARLGVDEAVRWLVAIAEQGVRPVPVLSFSERPNDQLDFAGWAAVVCARAGWIGEVELLNEPADRMTPARYASIVADAASAIRAAVPSIRIAVAGEILDTANGDRRGTWWDDFRRALSEDSYSRLVNLVAIHPYRDGKRQDWSGFGSREAEWQLYRHAAGEKGLLVSEVGWSLSGTQTPEVVGGYVRDELALLKRLGAEGALLYAYTGAGPGDMGLWSPTQTARPAALHLEQFLK